MGYEVDKSIYEFEIDIKDLTPGSKSIVIAECDFCKKEVSVVYNLYLKNISSNNLFSCSSKCGKYKSKMTNLERYGVEYVNQSKEVRDKYKMTNLERYGVEHASQSEEIKSKTKTTNLERYGVEYVLQSKIIRDRIKETNLERYGVDHNFKVKEIIEKRKETYLKNWGVDNPSKSDVILDKKKQTSIINWGVDNPMQSKIVQDRSRDTNLIRLGVEYPMQSETVREKSKMKLLNKYGVDHNSKLDFVKEKMKENNLKNWGVEYTLQSDEIGDRISETNLEKYGTNIAIQNDQVRSLHFKISKDENYLRYLHNEISIFWCDIENHEFEISSTIYHSRKKNNSPLCTHCYKVEASRPIKEIELLKYIKSVYTGEVVDSYRDRFEIDIYLPELKIGFEFNGLYFHSEKFKDKNYHIDKTKFFEDKGIRIIHIWEDDWDYKDEIIKSQINNWTGSTKNKIYARECEVLEIIDTKLIRSFLNKNHIQGYVNSIKKYGLFYKGELVSLMTFDKLEGRKRMKDVEWNLNRFCNKLNTSVIGGASKIFNHFINGVSPSRIISYADKDWPVGNLYNKLGFNKISESNPDYKYLVDNKRAHKSRYKKSRLKTDLSESLFMKENGIHKIYDCGKLKFELIIKKSSI